MAVLDHRRQPRYETRPLFSVICAAGIFLLEKNYLHETLVTKTSPIYIEKKTSNTGIKRENVRGVLFVDGSIVTSNKPLAKVEEKNISLACILSKFSSWFK